MTGKYRRGQEAPERSRLSGDARLGSADYDKLEALEEFSISRGYDLLTLAISWLASRKETVSVIAGATQYEQLSQNAPAAAWKMTEEEQVEIDQIVNPR